MFNPANHNLNGDEEPVAGKLNQAVEGIFDGASADDVGSGISAGMAMWNHVAKMRDAGATKEQVYASLAKIGAANLFDELAEKAATTPE